MASGHAHQSVAVCIIYIASHTPAHVRCLSCLVLIVLEITWGQFLHIVIIHTDCTPENIHVTPSTPTGLYSTFHLIIIHATHFLYPWKQSNYGPAATCRHQVCVAGSVVSCCGGSKPTYQSMGGWSSQTAYQSRRQHGLAIHLHMLPIYYFLLPRRMYTCLPSQ